MQERRLATVAREVHLRVSIIGGEGAGIASIIGRFVYHTDLYFQTSGELCMCQQTVKIVFAFFDVGYHCDEKTIQIGGKSVTLDLWWVKLYKETIDLLQ